MIPYMRKIASYFAAGATTMECLIGMKFNNFVLLAHDNNGGRDILVMKQDQQKFFKLDEYAGMVVCGEAGDTVYFSEFIQKNVVLYRIRNGYSMSPNAAANYTRQELAEALRKKPNIVNLLLGGYDKTSNTPSLYFMDYLGTLAEVPFAAHGYGSYFTYSLLDCLHRPDMTQSQAEELLLKCILELQKRFAINLPAFTYYFVDQNGVGEKKVLTVPPPTLTTTQAYRPAAVEVME